MKTKLISLICAMCTVVMAQHQPGPNGPVHPAPKGDTPSQSQPPMQVTAVLITVTNITNRPIGRHRDGQIVEHEYAIIEIWQLWVAGHPMTNRLVTNWVSERLDLVPVQVELPLAVDSSIQKAVVVRTNTLTKADADAAVGSTNKLRFPNLPPNHPRNRR
jgi:hypothetical protein